MIPDLALLIVSLWRLRSCSSLLLASHVSICHTTGMVKKEARGLDRHPDERNEVYYDMIGQRMQIACRSCKDSTHGVL